METSNWRKNISVFQIDSVMQWFQIAIGVWVLIWTKYMTFTQIGVVYSVGLFASILLQLPTGALADIIGRKKVIIIGRLLGIFGYVAYAVANNFWLFLIGEILYQANWAFESGALSALLYDSLKEHGKETEYYQKTESNTFFWCTIGMAGASVLGGFLYRYNIHAPYYACIVGATGAFIGAFFFDEPRIQTTKRTLKGFILQNWNGLKHIFSNNLIRSISLFSILIEFVGYAGLWYLYEPRLAQAGFSANTMGLLVAGTYLFRATATKLIPFIQKRVKNETVPLFLTVSQMVGSALSFIETRAGAITSAYLRKFSDGFRKPILARIQNEQISSEYRATSLSAIALLYNLLLAVAGPFIGIMMDSYHASKTLGAFFFVGLIFVLPAALHLRKQIQSTSH